MSKQSNTEFIKLLPCECQNFFKLNHIRLPEHIDFECSSKIEIKLPAKAVAMNMQTDDAAFEGWALSLYSILSKYGVNKKIYIDIEDGFEELGKKNKGHYNRFLYRLKKFYEQFVFVELSHKLSSLVGKFYYHEEDGYLIFDKEKLIINRPEKEAECREKPEAQTEELISRNPDMLITQTFKMSGVSLIDNIYRQLPVGIFRENVSKKTAVFTRGASAIDLWSVSKDKTQICIYELKVKDNAKVGIISELFFYANLMYDVYGPNPNFKKNVSDNAKRGYEKLAGLKEPIKEVYAYFLADKMHPLIRDEVIGLLSDDNIKYDIIPLCKVIK